LLEISSTDWLWPVGSRFFRAVSRGTNCVEFLSIFIFGGGRPCGIFWLIFDLLLCRKWDLGLAVCMYGNVGEFPN
jgi:hypothetical protein